MDGKGVMETMSSIARFHWKRFLPDLLLICFLGVCSTAHGQCRLRVENRAKCSDVRVILSRAAEVAVGLTDDQTGARSFQDIAHLLWGKGEKAEALQFYECAMKAGANVKFYEGSEVGDPFFRIDLIRDRAGHGDVSGALAHIKDFADVRLQDRARFDVLHELARQGKIEIAEQILPSISDTKQRDSALYDLARWAGAARKFTVADRAVHAVHDNIERIQALEDLALDLSKDGQRGRAISIFAEAVDLAKQLPSDDEGRGTGGAPQYWSRMFNSKDTMLGHIATQQLQAGLDSGVQDTLAMIEDRPTHAQVRHILAIERDRLLQALQLADHLAPAEQVATLIEIADTLLAAEDR